MIARAWKALVVLVLWRLGGLRRGAGEHEENPSRRSIEAPPWAERLVLGLLSAVPVAAASFVVLFVLEPDTQLLGLSLAAVLALLAAALVVAGRWLGAREAGGGGG